MVLFLKRSSGNSFIFPEESKKKNKKEISDISRREILEVLSKAPRVNNREQYHFGDDI